jgi:hypothetical protein
MIEPREIHRSKRTIDERFAEFHAANPQVYAELLRLARTAHGRGWNHIGIRMLWEVLRWNVVVMRTVPNLDDDFKLNDHFHSRYVRLLVEKEPDLAGLFEMRRLRAS